MDAELTAEALVGFRAWKIKGTELRAVWQTTSETWVEPGNVEAGCFVSPGCFMYGVAGAAPATKDEHDAHPPPASCCSCGIHAYYANDPAQEKKNGDCWGAIVAWGRIVECDRGFKAQYARPIALLEPDDDGMPESVAMIAERYELPVLPLDELEQYALMFGEVRIAELTDD